MIVFPELLKKTVHIGIGGGNYIEVPMLPVSDFATFQNLQLEIAKKAAQAQKDSRGELDMAEEAISVRNRLCALAKKVMPEETHERLATLDAGQLSQLILILCTGKDDAEKDDPQKKITLPSQTGVCK